MLGHSCSHVGDGGGEDVGGDTFFLGSQKLRLPSSSGSLEEGVSPNSEDSSLQKRITGTSLGVQRLRPCAYNAGDPGSIPGQEVRSHRLQLKPHTTK